MLYSEMGAVGRAGEGSRAFYSVRSERQLMVDGAVRVRLAVPMSRRHRDDAVWAFLGIEPGPHPRCGSADCPKKFSNQVGSNRRRSGSPHARADFSMFINA